MRPKYKIVSLIATLCLLLGIFQNTIYAESPKDDYKVLQPTSLGTVKLKENVTAIVKNVQIMPSDNHQTVGLTVTINNQSNSDINLIDYWIHIYTKSGTKLNVQNTNTKTLKVAAKTSEDLSYYATVGKDLNAADLIVKVIQWDFSSSSYTRVLGEIAVPARYNPVTPSGEARVVTADDVSATVRIKSATIGKSESYYRPDLKVTIKNDGKRTIVLPDYQLYIMTKDKLMYPLSVSNLKGTVLNPLAEQEFPMTVNIPLGVKTDGWKLVIMYPINEGKGLFPLAQFELPQSNVTEGEEIGKYYTFINAKGEYSIKLDSINRLPIDEDDLIIANLTIANRGKQTLPIPSLAGTYLLNESIEKLATINQNNKVIAIKPGATESIQLVSRVPYTFDIEKLKITIQQKETGENKTEELIELVAFNHKGAFTRIPSVRPDDGYKINDIGSRSTVKVTRFNQFEGTSANLISARLEVTNQEKRQSLIQQLAGYFEKEDGTVYPANIESVQDKLSPGGKAIVNAWAIVPKEIETGDVRLVIGKALLETSAGSANNETTNKEKLVGYAQPSSLILPQLFKAQDNLKNIDLQSYELSFTNVSTQIAFQESQVTFLFDYVLTQDLIKKSNMKDHKIIIEIQDANPKSVFKKEFSLPVGETGSDNQSAQLQLGENHAEVTWNNVELTQLITALKDYQLNVYYQITPGYKTLIASQKIPWLVNRSL
ncbi:hypothetical protein B1A99_22170 [Cohnella sp. CIP 111063]|uniref:hypothetical protein n=1 Tax=unclassified Cohnella TaxID=2636738 RepID=UPI000B8C3A44|nr:MULTISPECIES: hypothetical protein [unclassified Cohnella]OXS55933.1 hypothetical protein B1A99_22170 [Cohnella sp. CIP 111063]PRX67138.1 hypothetical protein B0G52_115148 [Cohnella sp. SGD-V74]